MIFVAAAVTIESKGREKIVFKNRRFHIEEPKDLGDIALLELTIIRDINCSRGLDEDRAVDATIISWQVFPS